MKVSELLDKPEKWTRDTYARDSKGNTIDYTHENACSFCLSGAIKRCYGYGHGKAWGKVLDAVMEFGFQSIPHFNDYEATTFEDIRHVIEKAGV